MRSERWPTHFTGRQITGNFIQIRLRLPVGLQDKNKHCPAHLVISSVRGQNVDLLYVLGQQITGNFIQVRLCLVVGLQDKKHTHNNSVLYISLPV